MDMTKTDNMSYIFVSYAHKDSAKVMPLIRELKDRGVRVWYDEGIEAGTEWPAYIEERLESCSGVLVFLSDNSIESVNCRNEINVAAELKKEMLVAQLDDEVTYKYGMRLQLSSRQKIFWSRHASPQSLVDELLKLRMFAECVDGTHVPSAHTEEPIKENKASVNKSNNKSVKLIIGAAAAVLVLVLSLLLLLPRDEAGGGDESGIAGEGSSSAASEESTASPEPEVIELSDELLDFTIELEGVVYKLPCAYSKFTDNGWTISSSGYSEDRMLAGLSIETYYMSKNGRRIIVCSYNPSGNAAKLSDCRIGGVEVSVDGGAELRLAKEITPASSADEIRAAYGAPNDSYTSSSYEKLTYAVNGSEYNFVEFFCYFEGNESSARIINLARTDEDNTVTNTAIPQYLSSYSAPAALGEDATASVLMIEGKLYKLPAPVSSFIADGWRIDSKPAYVVSGGSDSLTLKKDNKEMFIYIFNYAEYQTTAENCAVYKVELNVNEGVNISLPGIGSEIKLGMTVAELEPLLSDKFTFVEGSSYNFYNYNEYRDKDYSVSIMIDKATDTVYKLSVSCETWIH